MSRSYWPLVALAIALGVWLRAPALQASLVSDDWDHYAMCSGAYPNQRAAWDYFNFVSADARERRALLDGGRLPWWSDPALHLGFFRPLSSLSLWADYAVAGRGDVARLAHIHSTAWWALGVAAVAALLRRLLAPPAALVATLLYALDDAPALPLSWTASRGELIAVALMTWALVAHVAWKQSGLARHRLAALALLWLGMLSGEHALAMSAFLIACELGDHAAPLRARLQGLLPLVAPVLVYVAVRALLGYGAAGSSFYADPFAEPVRFVRALAVSVPLLAGDLGMGYAADAWYWMPTWRDALHGLNVVPQAWLTQPALQRVQLACGLLTLGGVALFWRALGTRTTPAARALRWLLAGAVLALVPLSAALPMTRLTVGPSIAFHAAFGWLLVEAWQVVRNLEPGRAASLGCRLGAALGGLALLGVHGVYAASQSRTLTAHYALVSHVERRWIAAAQLPEAGLSDRHVIVLSASDAATSFSLPFVRRFVGQSAPQSSELLLPPFREAAWLGRVSDTALEVWMPAADGLSDLRRSAYRRADRDFAVGQRFVGPRFAVELLAVERGLPTRLRFVFARPLEDASYVFVSSTPQGLRRFVLPRQGQAVQLPPPALPRPL